jgi:hypothetical protein
MLRLVESILKSIDPVNITTSDTQAQRDFGREMHRSAIMLVQLWHRYAKRKLATRYLAP